MLLFRVYAALPPALRARGKQVLGASGHSRGMLDRLKARKDALGKKRLDVALASVIDTLGARHLPRVAGATVVDFGAGYVPMDGVALWLLGARRVVAVDYNDIADFRALALGVEKADLAVVRTLLGAHAADGDWEERLRTLTHGIRLRPLSTLIPFEYRAPLDVIATPERLPSFDLLVSVSVLEHIPPSLLPGLLRALKVREHPSAVQLHTVDLRDHRDFTGAPYAFLDPAAQFDPETDADTRGNGMTGGDWARLLTAEGGLQMAVIGQRDGRPHLLSEGGRQRVGQDPLADFVTIGPPARQG